MWIAIILLGILSLILIISLILYRRQVVKLCRQVTFIRNTDTKMLLTSDCGYRELIRLIDTMNELIYYYRESKIVYERQNRQLKNTITGLSHDIRTPLTSLNGYFQLLCETTDEEEKKKYMAIIRKRIDSLSAILEELFTYAKLQDNDMVIKTEEICFTEVIYSSLFAYYDDFEAANIKPELDLLEKDVLVNANRDALKRVIENIVKNSFVHGNLYVGFKTYIEENRISFIAENNVINADDIDMSLIFERFYKADEARSNVSTGLGLSIAKALTEKMQGSIEAKLEDDIFSIKVTFDIVR